MPKVCPEGLWENRADLPPQRPASVRRLTSCLVLLAAGLTACAPAPLKMDKTELQEIVPAGTLRVGVVSAPAQSPFFVTVDSTGRPRGVTVDLGAALGQNLGVPVEFIVVPNSGEVTSALAAGTIDVAFMPVDDERRKHVDFGPDYFLISNTYLVRPGSDIGGIGDVDREGVRVVGIAGTTTIRTAGRLLKKATITAATSVGDAMELLRTGQADAFALTHDSLPPLAAQLPGSRILKGSFHQTGIAIAVQKGRPRALACVTDFMEEAKNSGLVRQAFDNAGFNDAAVAPPSR